MATQEATTNYQGDVLKAVSAVIAGMKNHTLKCHQTHYGFAFKVGNVTKYQWWVTSKAIRFLSGSQIKDLFLTSHEIAQLEASLLGKPVVPLKKKD